MHKKQIRADEYRRLADEAAALAKASDLDNVRDKHELAAAQWTVLAEQQECVPYAGPAQAALIGSIAANAPGVEELCNA